MEQLLFADEMLSSDRYTIEHIGIPSPVLMERAALEVARRVSERAGIRSDILSICGSGNNGGDGIAAARILHQMGHHVSILFAGNPEKRTDETKFQMEIAKKTGVPFVTQADFSCYDLIIDAIFGIGLARMVEGRYKDLIQAVNDSHKMVIAVDIPSGIHADTGSVMGCAVRCTETVAMQYAKPGHYLYPGCLYSGRVHAADIGVQKKDGLSKLYLPRPGDLKNMMPARSPDGNKGTFGKLLLIASTKNMAGAALLSARAALKTGVGMVKILTPEVNRVIVQCALPEALLSTYTTPEEAIACLKEDLQWCTAAAAGPGMGNSPSTGSIVRYLLRHAEVPLVLDADALNCLEGDTEILSAYRAKLVLTPHIGELARLTKRQVSELKADAIRNAVQIAGACRAVLIMKDARTVTAYPDRRVYLNVYGNDGMATAGSGDVLSGICGALLAQGGSPESAVLIHALAGDKAADMAGQASMTSGDIIDHIKYFV
jgi:hydroxyethylthiazole kinase-like uncharacterized protein yjeF